MQRDSFLKLLKFLGDYDSANVIRAFREDLTPYGFECFIADFFESKEYNFRVFLTGGFKDKGIDAKGIRVEKDGSKTFLAIQCKRWHWDNIQMHHIAEFYGNIADIARNHKIIGVFATTSWLTPNAWDFCQNHKIDMVIIDYRQLLQLHKEMNLYVWMADKMNSSKEEASKIFTQFYLRSVERTETDYFRGKIRTAVETRQKLNGLLYAKQLSLPIEEKSALLVCAR